MLKRTVITLITAITLALPAVAQQLPGTLIRDVATGRKKAFNEVLEKDGITLIAFWGTWCAHGKHEVKSIAREMQGTIESR